MKFINMTDLQLENQPDLVIAKYGELESKTAYCLDFYEKYQTPAGMEQSLALLLHDADSGPVTQISSSNETERLTIQIRREYRPPNSRKPFQMSYYYEYDSTNGILRGLSEIKTDLTDQ
jgi:hypothetical protein